LSTVPNEVNGKDIQSILPKHIAPGESMSFDKNDLSKLIRQASVDLDEIDKIRKDEFKKHELEKEYERREELTVCYICTRVTFFGASRFMSVGCYRNWTKCIAKKPNKSINKKWKITRNTKKSIIR
jgi:hypothetical protein